MIKFADGLSLDGWEFRAVYEERIKQSICEVKKSPFEVEKLNHLNSILGLLDVVPMKVNLWEAQNEFFSIVNSRFQQKKEKIMGEVKDYEDWLKEMETALNYLNISRMTWV